MSRGRKLKLGLFVQGAGHHVAGWRHPKALSGSENFDLIKQVAQKAEQAKLDMIFLADGLTTSASSPASVVTRFEPITLLAALSTVTRQIGLAVTASTTYYDPFNLARLIASVDKLSEGRAAWNVVTTSSPEAAQNFSNTAHLEHHLRYERAAEFVEVVKGLWDSWEQDPYIVNKETGEYIDQSKVHELNHTGKHFAVKGPLSVTQSPQGHPVIIQAGSSGPGQELAARIGEVVFTAQQSYADAQAFYASLKGRLPKYGRSPEHLHILPGLFPVIGNTEKEAKEKYEELQHFIDDSRAYATLEERFQYDLSGYSLDDPIPDIPESDGRKSRPQLLMKLAREKGLTLRQLYREVAGARGHRIVVGTANQLADHIQKWFEGYAADGFNIMPPFLPDGFDDFVEGVIPELQNRGLFRTEYEGSTLREHLGLPVPQNRHSIVPTL
ncbi:LLM class flavin-dependent oxidoreductase [Paenibacillus silvae]|jgi:alkanesulfonate monooxygenase|uniref:LLM class flavin-dependent oxidoreductase n=1 Tax=Paenibacillus TaxID=44249 RepID=UPI001C0FA3F5|nr:MULTISPECIES: LLM class flavin-dependent oxidoreductase [Paenibacillus]MBU5353411.1 LLM class flavin-dependent oxidoreductase [Paenibacillus barcinonensis]MDM5279627.1 LLM class flavin-dependent oxidoreductase [Paenibacillus silvae]